jgi:hypothetical protein
LEVKGKCYGNCRKKGALRKLPERFQEHWEVTTVPVITLNPDPRLPEFSHILSSWVNAERIGAYSLFWLLLSVELGYSPF